MLKGLEKNLKKLTKTSLLLKQGTEVVIDGM
jgi:hypothetical protein